MPATSAASACFCCACSSAAPIPAALLRIFGGASDRPSVPSLPPPSRADQRTSALTPRSPLTLPPPGPPGPPGPPSAVASSGSGFHWLCWPRGVVAPPMPPPSSAAEVGGVGCSSLPEARLQLALSCSPLPRASRSSHSQQLVRTLSARSRFHARSSAGPAARLTAWTKASGSAGAADSSTPYVRPPASRSGSTDAASAVPCGERSSGVPDAITASASCTSGLLCDAAHTACGLSRWCCATAAGVEHATVSVPGVPRAASPLSSSAARCAGCSGSPASSARSTCSASCCQRPPPRSPPAGASDQGSSGSSAARHAGWCCMRRKSSSMNCTCSCMSTEARRALTTAVAASSSCSLVWTSCVSAAL